MSNMGPFGNNKNPPWARGGVGNAAGGIVGQASPLQQQMLQQGTMGAMGATGMVQYQQSQPVFQTPMGMQQQNMGIGIQQITGNPSVSMSSALGQQLNPSQLFSQVGAVTYPNPRALNPTAFQTPGLTSVATGPGPGSVQVPTSQANSSTKQRVFTGTVTKVHDNFGFVDEDVFFQTTACVKGSNPVVGDRVLVEASFNPTMPFKWNATRIQVLPMSGNATGTSIGSGVVAGVNAALARAAQQAVSKSFTTGSSGYNAVPPPIETTNGNYQSSARSVQRSGKGSVGGRSRDRSRDRDRDDEEIERKRRREERGRDREEKDKKSPLRRRSRSPKSRRRVRVVPRYMVQIPKIALHLPEADVLEIRRRYTNLYVPSDFFHSQFRWIDAFPPHSPFTLNKPCQFHIMSKDIDSISETEAVLEPPDADYLFSAKVMLMSVPTMDEIYSKCCSIAEDMGRKDRDSEERDFVHPTRLINFLVGLRGKNETMAIGGPWSPSLDGENPDKDPSVLIKTAIRTCKALTGIDLSNCTQWYRFVELYYRRAETSHRGKLVAARVETVVLFLPDVWSCVPTRLEWDALHQAYRKQLERRLRADHGDDCVDEPSNADEKEEEAASENKAEPTHYSQLDPKTMSLPALRTELKARGINSKGLKSQLIARLGRALKSEIEKTENEDHNMETDQNDSKIEIEEKEDKRKENDEKRLDEREKQQLEKRYALPDEQHIIVHPSRIAKSGKFDCTIMSLSLLLDYRPEDTKEHSFEVSLFAELFNEMLMRDFAFIIYKAIHDHPERTKETKDDKKKKDDDKKNKRDDKDKKDDKNDKKDKDDRKDDKRKGKDDDDDEVVEDVDDDDDDDKKDKGEKRKSTDRDRKKKERIQLVTKDKNLLLSFVYFDQTHCGYIFEKDMEDLIYTLGLSLSRAQVRKLVSKVVTRDSLHYRKLTDRLKEELDQPSNTVSTTEEQTELPPSAEELAYGNKKLLPIFKNGSVPRNSINNTESNREMEENCSNDKTQLAEGLVMYQGALMDVGKLLNQLNRSEKARIDTETRMIELKKENTKLTEKNEKSSNIIKNLTGELSDCKKKLQNSDDALHKVTNCSNLYHSTLLEIKEKIEPVIGMSGMKNQHPDVSEIKKEGHESRWEVEIKTEIKEENSTDKNEQTIVIQE